jgi:hypothetical protein
MALFIDGSKISSSDISSTGQFNKVMAHRQGCVLYLDSAQWSGSGDYTDLINGITLTNESSVTASTYSSVSAFSFTSEGQRFTGTLGGTRPSKESTIEAWVWPASTQVNPSGDRGTIFLCTGNSGNYHSYHKSTNELSSYWYNHTPAGYHEGLGLTTDTWNYTAAIWDYRKSTLTQYLNSTCNIHSSIQGDSDCGSNIVIGMESTTRQFTGGIAILRYWNRALSGPEIMFNYYAEKGRFGL